MYGYFAWSLIYIDTSFYLQDKEYPAKALQIAKLKRQREILEATFKVSCLSLLVINFQFKDENGMVCFLITHIR